MAQKLMLWAEIGVRPGDSPLPQAAPRWSFGPLRPSSRFPFLYSPLFPLRTWGSLDLDISKNLIVQEDAFINYNLSVKKNLNITSIFFNKVAIMEFYI